MYRANNFVKRNKYGNQKVLLDGIEFDSRKEARRWYELKILEKAGEITGLQRQVKFVLIPTQRDENGKLLEKECSYYADFVYTDVKNGGTVIVEDTKSEGTRTEVYKIKKKLLLYLYNILIHEI